jgi:hypothetical protein
MRNAQIASTSNDTIIHTEVFPNSLLLAIFMKHSFMLFRRIFIILGGKIIKYYEFIVIRFTL